MAAGASDFVMLPLRSEELMLRLQLLLMRRSQDHGNETMEFLRCEGLVLDIQDHRVWKNGNKLYNFSVTTHNPLSTTAASSINDLNQFTKPVLLKT